MKIENGLVTHPDYGQINYCSPYHYPLPIIRTSAIGQDIMTSLVLTHSPGYIDDIHKLITFDNEDYSVFRQIENGLQAINKWELRAEYAD